ncbi:MAG: urea ABC transporter permease subunit UrtB [Elstera sp.]
MTRFLRAVMVLLGLAISLPSVAQTDAFETGLGRLAQDSFSETIAAITEIATSAAPNAALVVEALADSRLFFTPDKQILVKDAAGSLIDARTGAAVSPAPASLSPVRLNNRVRNVVQGALGNLGILSPDPVKRKDAGLAVLRSKDASALPALEAAIGREKDRAILKIMETARAAILVTKADTSEKDRLAGIALLQNVGTQEALATLRNLPPDAPPAVVEAARVAAKTIEDTRALWEIAQTAWYGLSLGSVLLLAAIGLAITFGVMGVINMAHGEMVMIGAYTTFVVQEVIRAHSPGLFDYSLVFALPLAFLVAGLVGLVIERSVIRFLYGRPLETLLATWGISLMLQQAVRTYFGPTNQAVGSPAFMSGLIEIGGLSITLGRLWIIVFALLAFLALLGALRYTHFGLQIRAVTQNRRMAASMGIRTNYIDALTFALGSGIAGVAGVALSQIDNVSPNLGQSYIIDSFMVVVFGGVGNLWGTLVSALSLGIANKILEPFAGAVLGKILILVGLILFVQKHPRGLFPQKGRGVEA